MLVRHVASRAGHRPGGAAEARRRMHSVYWNPILKQLEPMCCSRCGNGAFGLAFTDDEVEPFLRGVLAIGDLNLNDLSRFWDA